MLTTPRCWALLWAVILVLAPPSSPSWSSTQLWWGGATAPPAGGRLLMVEAFRLPSPPGFFSLTLLKRPEDMIATLLPKSTTSSSSNTGFWGSSSSSSSTTPWWSSGTAAAASTAKSSRAIILDKWRVTRTGALLGVVRDHPTLVDGSRLKTSTLSLLNNPANANGYRILHANMVVETVGGSKYLLGEPRPAGASMNTMATAALLVSALSIHGLATMATSMSTTTTTSYGDGTSTFSSSPPELTQVLVTESATSTSTSASSTPPSITSTIMRRFWEQRQDKSWSSSLLSSDLVPTPSARTLSLTTMADTSTRSTTAATVAAAAANKRDEPNVASAATNMIVDEIEAKSSAARSPLLSTVEPPPSSLLSIPPALTNMAPYLQALTGGIVAGAMTGTWYRSLPKGITEGAKPLGNIHQHAWLSQSPLWDVLVSGRTNATVLPNAASAAMTDIWDHVLVQVGAVNTTAQSWVLQQPGTMMAMELMNKMWDQLVPVAEGARKNIASGRVPDAMTELWTRLQSAAGGNMTQQQLLEQAWSSGGVAARDVMTTMWQSLLQAADNNNNTEHLLTQALRGGSAGRMTDVVTEMWARFQQAAGYSYHRRLQQTRGDAGAVDGGVMTDVIADMWKRFTLPAGPRNNNNNSPQNNLKLQTNTTYA